MEIPKKNEFNLDELLDLVLPVLKSDIFGSVEYLYPYLDPDGKGFFTISDLRRVSVANSFSYEEKLLSDAFSRVDTDRDGMISYREFMSLIK